MSGFKTAKKMGNNQAILKTINRPKLFFYHHLMVTRNRNSVTLKVSTLKFSPCCDLTQNEGAI